MNAYRWLVATFLVILVVALAPQSSWFFKNAVDLDTGRVRYVIGETVSMDAPPTAEQRSLPVSNRFERNVKESPNVAASLVFRYWEAGKVDPMAPPTEEVLMASQDSIDRFIDQFLASNGSDAVALGILLKHVSVTPSSKPETGIHKDMRRRRVLRMLKVADAAAKADPDNLVPRLSLASVHLEQGRTAQMRRALEAAAAMTKVDCYGWEEGAAMISAVEARDGYLGELTRISIISSVLFPNFAGWRTLANRIGETGSLKDRLLVAKIGLTIARDDDLLIQSMVAVGMVRGAVQGDAGFGRADRPDRDKLKQERLASLAAFRRQVEREGLPTDDPFWTSVETVVCSEYKADRVSDLSFAPRNGWFAGGSALVLFVFGAAMTLLPSRRVSDPAQMPKLKTAAVYLVLSSLPIAIAIYVPFRMPQPDFPANEVAAACLISLVSMAIAKRGLRHNVAIVLLAVSAIALVVGSAMEIQRNNEDRKVMEDMRTEAKRVKVDCGLGSI